MKTRLLKLVVLLISISSQVSVIQAQPITPDQIALVQQVLKDPQALELLNQTIKTLHDISTRSGYNNVCESYKGFAHGCNGFGIGLSRLLLDCSKKFSFLGQAAADHYWIFGGMIVSSLFFYKYILPNIKISVEYKNGANVPAPWALRPR